jgi:hypothetical protein
LTTVNKTGIVDLPLHSGHAPSWLFERMKKLAGQVAYLVVEDEGELGFLRRVSDPLWFQGFGCLLGFDWHSSGLTTVTLGALKESLSEMDIGIKIAGGKGKMSRALPEIARLGSDAGLSEKKASELLKASRLTAKVDSSAVQSGHQLYFHCFIFDEEGNWTVVQQGMLPESGTARRYHWSSTNLVSLVVEPHSGIIGQAVKNPVLNMVAKDVEGSRRASLEVIRELGGAGNPLSYSVSTSVSLDNGMSQSVPHYAFPLEIDWKKMDLLYDADPKDYQELLLVQGVGPKTVKALALVAEIIYGVPAVWRDPVKYSYSHGGKDGVPFPVDRNTYDATIDHLHQIIESLEMGGEEKKLAAKRLSRVLVDSTTGTSRCA